APTFSRNEERGRDPAHVECSAVPADEKHGARAHGARELAGIYGPLSERPEAPWPRHRHEQPPAFAESIDPAHRQPRDTRVYVDQIRRLEDCCNGVAVNHVD